MILESLSLKYLLYRCVNRVSVKVDIKDDPLGGGYLKCQAPAHLRRRPKAPKQGKDSSGALNVCRRRTRSRPLSRGEDVAELCPPRLPLSNVPGQKMWSLREKLSQLANEYLRPFQREEVNKYPKYISWDLLVSKPDRMTPNGPGQGPVAGKGNETHERKFPT